MIIYIAGPYAPIEVSLHDAAQLAHRNVMNVIKTFWEIAAKGHIPIAPHLSHFLHIHQPDDAPTPPQMFWYDYDLTLLRASDAILLIGDWKKSTGAVNELAYAKSLGLDLFYDIKELEDVTKRR